MRKDPQTDSEKLTNTIAYAAPGGDSWRVAAEEKRFQCAGRGDETDGLQPSPSGTFTCIAPRPFGCASRAGASATLGSVLRLAQGISVQ